MKLAPSFEYAASRSLLCVTRFSKILPLRQNFKRLWQILKRPLRIWQNVEHTLASSLCYWANFQCCKWPNIEKGHTGPT